MNSSLKCLLDSSRKPVDIQAAPPQRGHDPSSARRFSCLLNRLLGENGQGSADAADNPETTEPDKTERQPSTSEASSEAVGMAAVGTCCSPVPAPEPKIPIQSAPGQTSLGIPTLDTTSPAPSRMLDAPIALTIPALPGTADLAPASQSAPANSAFATDPKTEAIRPTVPPVTNQLVASEVQTTTPTQPGSETTAVNAVTPKLGHDGMPATQSLQPNAPKTEQPEPQALPPNADAGGTPVAEVFRKMQNLLEEEQIAGHSAASQGGSGKDGHASGRASQSSESQLSVPSPMWVAEGANPSALQDSSELAEPASFPETVVDRLITQVQEGAVHFRRIRQDSVDVLVTPDQDTQIALRFATKEGRMEAALRLETGNPELLVRHWPELRRILAEQGVHLLEPDASMGMNLNWDNNSHQYGHQFKDSNEEANLPTLFNPAQPPGNSRQKPSNFSKTTSRRLLESYA